MPGLKERTMNGEAAVLLPVSISSFAVEKAPKKRFLTLLVIIVSAFTFLTPSLPSLKRGYAGRDHTTVCAQPPSLAPPSDDTLDRFRETVLHDQEFKKKSVHVVAGAVQIPTESFDDNGEPNEDPRWGIFPSFHEYLATNFPLVHKTLTLEKVNTLGLLYTWKGSNEELKPLVLMAHYDVVPVNPSTLDQWTYPPYSGHYDGEYIWGRGSSDTKSLLIAHMEALEHLISASFRPKRTILLSYGFDEETMRKRARGAAPLAERIEEIYGKDGVEMLIDEGGNSQERVIWGRRFLTPGMGEKGYVNINVTLSTPGGHSSIPGPHTGIGILSSLISNLESTPYSPYLAEKSPYFGLLQCGAEHGSVLDAGFKKAVLHGGKKERDALAKEIAERSPADRSMVTTTQATDIIRGGVKVNALPEKTFVTINHRIAVEQSVQTIKDRFVKLARETSKRFNLDVDAFGYFTLQSDSNKSSGGMLEIVSTDELEPSPVTPRGEEILAWNVMAGTIKHVYEGDDEAIVAPGMLSGNTDTRFYWNLTRNIYRFSPLHGFGAHTVDERSSMDDHLKVIIFFHTLIRSMDEAR